jgi:hypothetical protein
MYLEYANTMGTHWEYDRISKAWNTVLGISNTWDTILGILAYPMEHCEESSLIFGNILWKSNNILYNMRILQFPLLGIINNGY